MLYLAPLQGLTDYIFRAVFSKHFSGIDAYFIPYISLKSGIIKASQLKEILPENNIQQKIVPQVLFKDQAELNHLIMVIKDFGYNEINLNLGCPYPMVTNQGKGAGLLSYPEKLDEILETCLKEQGMVFSVKLRTGLKHKDEILQVIDVLNRFSFSEVIYHPRLASQLYKGLTLDETIAEVLELSVHPVVLNGDIFSKEIFDTKRKLFPAVENWMLGRGILMNPFLAEEITGIKTSGTEKFQRLENFHGCLFVSYSGKLSGSGHLLAKMKQFWEYFSYSFENQHKVFKLIKKATSIKNYNLAVGRIFREND